MGVIVICFHLRKQPLGITYKPFGAAKWIQFFSLAKNLLSHTTLMTSSKKTIWVSWSFVNWFIKKKNPKLQLW
jgi:hypothetical protein